MIISQTDQKILSGLLNDLSAGQLSTVIAALNESNALIGTSKDSENYAFLAKLIELDMAEEETIDIDLPPEMADMLTSIHIKDTAKPVIKSLLDRYKQQAEAGSTNLSTSQTLYSSGEPNPWTVILDFDDQSSLHINSGNKDSEWIIIVAKENLKALENVLTQAATSIQPEATSPADNVIPLMIEVFGLRDKNPFKDIEAFLVEHSIPYKTQTWIGG